MTTGTALACAQDSNATVHRTNISHVDNHQDNRFKAGHHIQLDFPGSHSAILNNKAYAYESCDNCDELSVAIQVAMFSPSAKTITLNNTNDAVVYKCNHCNVVTVALQWVVIAPDWYHVPANVQSFMRDSDNLLDHIKRNHLTLAQAVAQLNGLIAKYQSMPPTAGAAPIHGASVKPGSPAAQAGLHVQWKQANS